MHMYNIMVYTCAFGLLGWCKLFFGSSRTSWFWYVVSFIQNGAQGIVEQINSFVKKNFAKFL